MGNDMPRRFSNCLNTGKICLFTDTGKMHQIKVMDLPYGRFRDKGVPIDNVSNYSSSEEQIVTICDAQQIAFEKLLFATKQGMIKRVDGSEFQVAKRTIAATKLQEEDALIHVGMVQENQNIVLQTRDGYFLRFLTAEIPEKKKGAVGVRGIKLQKTDELEQIHRKIKSIPGVSATRTHFALKEVKNVYAAIPGE